MRTHIALDQGTLVRARLSRRLRALGFQLIVNRIDDRHAAVVIAPPTTLPLPGMKKGRTFHLVTRLHSSGLAVANSEFGSTSGLPVPGL